MGEFETKTSLARTAPFVLTGSGGIVEIQGTAEDEPFSAEQFSHLMDLARKGVDELVAAQKKTLGKD